MANEAGSKVVDLYTKQGAELAAAIQAQAVARSRGETDEPPDPIPDPVRTVQMAEAIGNELPVIEREDGTPEVLVVADHPKVTWAQVLAPLVVASNAAIAEPDGIIYPGTWDETPLQFAIRGCQAVYARVGTAIDGNKQNKKRAAAHRKAVFQGRSVNATRPAWEREIGLIIAALNGLKDATPAERAMIPVLEKALANLRTAPATSPGRSRSEPTYSFRVQATTLALSCALSDFLSWCAAKASDKRLASVQRIITPKVPERPKAEQKPEAKAEQKPEAKPEVPASTAAAAQAPKPPDAAKPEAKPEVPANTAAPVVAQGTPGPVAGGQTPAASGPTVQVPEKAPVPMNGAVRPQA